MPKALPGAAIRADEFCPGPLDREPRSGPTCMAGKWGLAGGALARWAQDWTCRKWVSQQAGVCGDRSRAAGGPASARVHLAWPGGPQAPVVTAAPQTRYVAELRCQGTGVSGVTRMALHRGPTAGRARGRPGCGLSAWVF